MIRSAWVDTYLQTQEMLGLKEGQGVSAEDAADFKVFETRLQEQMANYRGTVTTEEDKIEFAAFEKARRVQPNPCRRPRFAQAQPGS
jgi:methyl-accepting chemotaxis protein WspA